jgi:SAM-dependent methyltransferase
VVNRVTLFTGAKMDTVKETDNFRTAEGYHPHDYWTKVAQEIRACPNKTALTGDDTPFLRLKRATFITKFLCRVPVQGKAVLEVGCGQGGNLARIAQSHPRKLVGCDISEAMVELARKNTSDLGGVEIVHVDGTTLPFSDRSFDVTYTSTVLQHNHDSMLTKLLSEICRVTDDQLYLFEDTGRFKKERYSFVLRPVNEYVALCAANGFELCGIEPLGLYVSESASRILRVVFSRNRKEGQPVTNTHFIIEEAALAITRTLDKVVSQRRGLTKTVFQRKPWTLPTPLHLAELMLINLIGV